MIATLPERSSGDEYAAGRETRIAEHACNLAEINDMY
jgi:hypothetical protein